MATIGFLDSTTSPNARREEMDAFYEGLALEGRNGSNTMMLHAWADYNYSLLPALAQQLIDANVGVIVAAGGPVSAIAAQNKTTTIPIVFTTITDPALSGLCTNWAAPEANVTGTFGHTTDLDDERLKGLDKIAPSGPLGILLNPKRPFPRDVNATAQRNAYQDKAAAVNRQAFIVEALTVTDIQNAFSTFHGHNIKGLLVSADSLFNSHRQAVIALAEQLGVPAMYQWRKHVEDGGLMAFGPDKKDGYRRAGRYAGRILNGDPVVDLPVLGSEMRDFFVSTQAASRSGLDPKSSAFLNAANAMGGVTITEI